MFSLHYSSHHTIKFSCIIPYALQSHRRYIAMVYVGFSEGLVLYVGEVLGYLFTELYSGGKGMLSDLSV